MQPVASAPRAIFPCSIWAFALRQMDTGLGFGLLGSMGEAWGWGYKGEEFNIRRAALI